MKFLNKKTLLLAPLAFISCKVHRQEKQEFFPAPQSLLSYDNLILTSQSFKFKDMLNAKIMLQEIGEVIWEISLSDSRIFVQKQGEELPIKNKFLVSYGLWDLRHDKSILYEEPQKMGYIHFGDILTAFNVPLKCGISYTLVFSIPTEGENSIIYKQDIFEPCKTQKTI